MTSAIGGADPTRTTTEAEFGLGDVVSDGQGNVYVYVEADEAITANAAVLIDETAGIEMSDLVSTAAGFGDRVGVVSVAFVSAEFGWAQIYGTAIVNVATSAAANAQLNSTASVGRLDDNALSGSEIILGLVLSAAESGNLAACVLNYPTVAGTIA